MQYGPKTIKYFCSCDKDNQSCQDLKMLKQNRKSCLIYAWDGHDEDIYHNLAVFYKSCGYRVKSSNTFKPSNLLVIARITPDIKVPSDLYDQIHIYEYIIHSAISVIHEHDKSKWTFISLDETQLQIASDKKINSIKSFIPIIPQLWQTQQKLNKSKNKFVHIGNFKPIRHSPNSVSFQEIIVTLCSNHDLSLWGKNWPLLCKSRGNIPLYRISKIYSASSATIGSMYPHQAGKSLSGRMWHAPLCGCTCIVDTNCLNNFPGNVSMNPEDILHFKIADISTKHRRHLARSSSIYWKNHLFHLASLLDLNISFYKLCLHSAIHKYIFIGCFGIIKHAFKIVAFTFNASKI